VPNVVCISGLFIIDCHFSFLKQHWAYKTQKDDNESKGTTQQTEGTVNNKQSRDTGNIGHTTHRRTTIKAKEPHSKRLLCCFFALIDVLLYLVCPMLPVSLDCLLLIATSVFCIVFLFCLSSFRLVPNVAWESQ
jgi:hypothetical protein